MNNSNQCAKSRKPVFKLPNSWKLDRELLDRSSDGQGTLAQVKQRAIATQNLGFVNLMSWIVKRSHEPTGFNNYFKFYLSFSAVHTSVQFSLKTWHQEGSWLGLVLFLTLSRKLKIRKKLKRFWAPMWLRRALTTFQDARKVQLMPDATQL